MNEATRSPIPRKVFGNPVMVGATRCLIAALLASAAAAGATEAPAATDVAQANNPLANFTAFNLHNYYIGEFADTSGENGDQFFMRYASPFSLGQTKWLMRATLPINSPPSDHPSKGRPESVTSRSSRLSSSTPATRP